MFMVYNQDSKTNVDEHQKAEGIYSLYTQGYHYFVANHNQNLVTATSARYAIKNIVLADNSLFCHTFLY